MKSKLYVVSQARPNQPQWYWKRAGVSWVWLARLKQAAEYKAVTTFVSTSYSLTVTPINTFTTQLSTFADCPLWSCSKSGGWNVVFSGQPSYFPWAAHYRGQWAARLSPQQSWDHPGWRVLWTCSTFPHTHYQRCSSSSLNDHHLPDHTGPGHNGLLRICLWIWYDHLVLTTYWIYM